MRMLITALRHSSDRAQQRAWPRPERLHMQARQPQLSRIQHGCGGLVTGLTNMRI